MVNHQSNSRLIDSNVKIEALQKEVERKAATEPSETSETEFVSGLNFQGQSYVEPELVIEDAQTKASQMIEDAKTQAKNMVDKAAQEKERIFEQAFQEGKSEGYRDGTLTSQIEYDQKVIELEEKEQKLQKDYDDKQSQMEPLIVDTLLEVIEKVLELQITDKREIILSLIRKSILHIENTKDFRVFLNRTQLDYLNEHFQRFQKELGQGKTVTCFSDDSLMDEQCRIETDFGTYYCGFDTYFRNLVKEIKTLSI